VPSSSRSGDFLGGLIMRTLGSVMAGDVHDPGAAWIAFALGQMLIDTLIVRRCCCRIHVLTRRTLRHALEFIG